MAKKVKCPYCESYLEKEEAVSYKKRYYHEDCFNEWEQQKEHRKALIEYICELHNLEAPTGMMVKQIKDFQDDYSYKLKGIELALRYFYETLDNRVREGDGIGIVPYVYEEAKRHYLKKKNIEKSAEEYANKTHETRVVTVSSPEFKYRAKVNSIDISAL